MLLKQDPTDIMKLLIDAEMKMFRGLNVKVIFLQNIVTDLMLGFGIKDVFINFVKYIEEEYKTRAGFITLNMPKLVGFLLECGIEEPIVCSAINKAGFQMNPDIASYEASLQNNSFKALAMSVLAAGAVFRTDPDGDGAGLRRQGGRGDLHCLVLGRHAEEFLPGPAPAPLRSIDQGGGVLPSGNILGLLALGMIRQPPPN